MKPSILPVLLLCIGSSCQPVNKDEQQNTPAADAVKAYPAQEPDIAQLRGNLFAYFERHRSEDRFDTSDDTYQRYGGPANYPPYSITAGHLFHKQQLHALLYYSDEQGAGLFVYIKQDGRWIQMLADTAARVMAGNSSPEFKDWNGDGIKDLCLYYAPALSMSVIGNYALWLLSPDGKQIRYIRGFDRIENPEVVHGKITGSYYYHGEHKSEYRIREDSAIKIKETWVRQD